MIHLDQSQWRHVAVVGEDRVRFLHNMCSSNIETLAAGESLKSLLLSHKARVLAVIVVQAFPDYLLVSCPPELGQAMFDLLDRHIVAEDVDLEERTLAMYTPWKDAESVWTQAPVLGEPEASSLQAVECMRIEAGFPSYGVDVSDANFPFESPLVRLVDYDKGCFLGQEPVARVKARGGGNKQLRGLRLDANAVQVGAEIICEGKSVAVITSVAESERFGSIGLATLGKLAWEPGTVVSVAGEPARVVELPFSDSD